MVIGTDAQLRFWAKVDRRSQDECWEWTASKSRDGYGKFWADGSMYSTHRLSFLMANGEIPEGLWVLHRCDNKPCVNPAHLFAGTREDNMLDMESKGRRKRYWRNLTHCLRGHEFSESNTYVRTNGTRQCMRCTDERAARKAVSS